MKRHAGLALALATFGLSPPASAYRTYFADEAMHYDDCDGDTLVSDIDLMLETMDDDGWSGLYYPDGNAWTTDFRESCSTQYGFAGGDVYAADSAALSIFSGHGGDGLLFFTDDVFGCHHSLSQNGRLGSMAGSNAAVSIYASCLTLHSLPQGANSQWVRQNLGFYDVVDNGLRKYYKRFYVDSEWGNAEAWLDEFDGGGLRRWEPATVVAYGSSSSNCWFNYDNVSLKLNHYMYPRPGGPSCEQGQPYFYYCEGWV